MNPKRFKLFSFDYYYPCGGMNDFIEEFDTKAEIMLYVMNKENHLQDFIQIHDCFEKKTHEFRNGEDFSWDQI